MPIRFKHGIEVDGSVTVDGQSLGTNAFNSTTIPTHTSNLTNDSGFITQAAGDLRYLQSVPRDVALGTTVLDRGVEFHDAGGDLSWAIGGNDRGGIGQVGQNAFVIRTRTGTRFQVGTGWAEEGTEMMTIDDGGRVGFTAPTPSTRFEIRDNGFTNNRLRIRNTSGASNSDASIELVNDDDGAGHGGGTWLARSFGWGNATLQLGGTTTGQWSGRYNINTTQKTYFENSGGVGIRVVPDTMLDVAGEITGRGGDTGLIFKSRNTSATGAPDQFKIEHNYGSVNISNPRGDINFTTALKYGGNTVATQSWVSGQSYATTSQLNSKADISHKYHTFSNGQYYYDSYSQGNYLRMFTQTANFDQVRFEPYYNVESSSNGVDWTPFDDADSLMRNILDGNESTGYNLALENRALRFEIQRNSGWPTTALIVWQETWSGLARPDCTMSIETWDGSSWIMREANIAFNGSTTASNYGTHLYVSTNLHQGQNRIRVTVIYDDWSNNNNYPTYATVPLRNFMILSNYSGHSILPYDWDYDQDMFIRGDAYSKGAKLATENFVSNYLPLSGGTINGDLTVNNQLTFSTGNVAGPSTTNQDAGSRIILYPQTNGRHYAIGIESSNMWFNSDGGYNFYNDSNNIASLSGSGVLYVNGGNSGQWNTAYSWGNHATAGYLDEVPSNYVQWEYNSVDLDPNDVNRARGVISINGTNANTPNRPQNYNTIYTLGGGSNNTLQLATGSDYHDSGLWIRQYNFNAASPQGVGWQNWATVWTSNDFANNSADWNEAHGWGNHADAGYAASSHNHSASDITSGNLSGDRLTWNSNDGFTGTYPIVWRATNDLYTSSWLQVRGSDDALLTRNIIADGTVNANGSILGGGNLFLRSYNNDPKGIFFRDGFEYGDTNQYNLSITIHDDGDGAADGMNINAYDGVFFNVASGTTPSTKFRVLSGEVKAFVNLVSTGNVYASGGNSTEWNAAYDWGNHANRYLELSGGTITKTSTHVTQGSISADNAHLDLYNNWESDTDQKGSIITFTDNYYDGSNYRKTLRAAIKGGTDTIGNTADGYLEFYTDSAGANSPNLVLRLDRNKNAAFSGSITTATHGSSSNWKQAYDWGDHANLYLPLSGGTLSGDIKVLYNDHASGAGYDTQLYIGKSDTLGLQGAFPTYVPAGSYGFFSHAYSDGMFVGSVPVSAGASNYYATIAWGDDAAEYLQFLYKGNQVARLETDGDLQIDGTLYANGGNSGQWNQAVNWGNHANAGYLGVTAQPRPAAPTTVTATVVGETIEIAFNQSATAAVDYYQVWAAQDSGSFSLIGQIPHTDFADTMTVVDAVFAVKGTRNYRVYAVRKGIYSDAATASRAFTSPSLEPVNLSVVPMEEAFFVQWDAPNSRFVDHYEVYVHSAPDQGALDRGAASLAYSGTNTFYMYQATNNEFHQFWVDVIES